MRTNIEKQQLPLGKKRGGQKKSLYKNSPVAEPIDWIDWIPSLWTVSVGRLRAREHCTERGAQDWKTCPRPEWNCRGYPVINITGKDLGGVVYTGGEGPHGPHQHHCVRPLPASGHFCPQVPPVFFFLSINKSLKTWDFFTISLFSCGSNWNLFLHPEL